SLFESPSFTFYKKSTNRFGWCFFVWWSLGEFPHTTVCYRLAYARCPRRQKQFPELFSPAIAPSLFESPSFTFYKKAPTVLVGAF
ncbi:MAG: hypothetical protein UHE86_08835, partial [Acutalibacteraceae bacterium]|nr:hypothetical protein [Acutalibacteraceae bacterium]